MSHLPVDHPLRGLYRGLTVVTGAATAAYGAIALLQTSGDSFTDNTGEKVWGMTANPAAGVFWIAVGVIALLAALVGRNVDVKVNWVLGPALWVIGSVGLVLIRNGDNVLAFSVTSVCVMYLLGTVWFTAALYGGVAGSGAVRRPSSADESAAKQPVGAAH
jgi:hypothetical protein